MLWHYTTRAAALAIRQGGVLLAHPVLVYAELAGPFRGEKPRELLPPVVWLTINPIFDLAVVIRETTAGFRPDRPGDFWRFGLGDEVTDVSLPEWAEMHGYPAELFRWMLMTGHAAGSEYTTWRLAERDLVRAEWLAVEQWDGHAWRHVDAEDVV